MNGVFLGVPWGNGAEIRSSRGKKLGLAHALAELIDIDRDNVKLWIASTGSL